MNETTHDFGFGPVPAHRHTNPDGSEGGWVADTATVESTVWVSGTALVFGNAQVSEVEVTDGGTGYSSTPCVQFRDQPGLAVTGTGAGASVALKAGHATGDPDTGVVWWEVFETPFYWWLCLSEYKIVEMEVIEK